MEKDKYILEMQVARGAGILLVTVGHSEPIKDVFPLLYSIIYAFHMPFFFFLSGFFASKMAKIDSILEWRKEVWPRLVPLLIPYFVISLSYAFIKSLVPQLVKRPIVFHKLLFTITVFPLENPALFMWFLYIIIIMRAFAPLLTRVNRYLLFAALVAIQVFPLSTDLFALAWTLNYLVYYCLGLYISSLKERFLMVMRTPMLPPLSAAFFIAGYILTTVSGLPFLKFLTALFGITGILSICFCYVRYMPVRILETFGKYSLQIYLLQYYFIFPVEYLLQKTGLGSQLTVLGTFLVGLAGPLAVASWVFPGSRILALLFGGTDSTRRAR
jgi:fucose 4-O-acetylase-like acetyltransferase